MPQVKLHVASTIRPENKKKLVEEVREAISQVLGIDENIGQVMLYETSPENRSIHDSRDPGFVFVETFMCPGRTREMKAAVMAWATGANGEITGCVAHTPRFFSATFG